MPINIKHNHIKFIKQKHIFYTYNYVALTQVSLGLIIKRVIYFVSNSEEFAIYYHPKQQIVTMTWRNYMS